MPPRRAATLAATAGKVKEDGEHVPVKKQRMTSRLTKLPEKIPNGELLTDVVKRQWKLGKSVGVGGFGEIYLADGDVTRPVSDNAQYVIKIEPHSNGPLYVEMHFYQRVAKPEMINDWQTKKRLDFLGMPKFIAFGSHEYNGNQYRFMVMERFGDDIQKLFLKHNKRFSLKTVATLAQRIIDSLEYIHEAGYIHADIKGSNLLLGFGPNRENEVYLVDFGLVSPYAVEGKHKEYKEDPRAAHNGTIEFTSRDAHNGVTSRRSDFEILGYNMVLWLAGKLPWEDNLKNVKYVQDGKQRFMENIPDSLQKLFPDKSYPEFLEKYLTYVADLGFDDKPDYTYCKKILSLGLKKLGIVDDGKLELDEARKRSPSSRVKKMVSKPTDIPHENCCSPAPRAARAAARKPCGLAENNGAQNDVAETITKPCKPADSVSPSLIPTPAMREVMERMKLKELKKNPKSNRAVKDTVPKIPVRAQPARKVRKVPSPNASFSPEIF